MRLRPSGNQGPVAVKLDSFEAYQRGSAWTWERMALTRARVLAGPTELKARIEAIIRESLSRGGGDLVAVDFGSGGSLGEFGQTQRSSRKRRAFVFAP